MTPERSTPLSGRPLLDAAGNIVVAILLLAALTPIAFYRLVDTDEGFYCYAAKLVLEGKTPYADFFYPQMPYLPYLFAAVFKVTGISWMAGRMVSVAAAVTLGVLLYRHVIGLTGKTRWGFAAVLLFIMTIKVAVWYTTIKSYSVSTLLIFVSYLLLHRWLSSRSRWLLLLCGLFFGLAIGCRLTMAGLAPVYLYILLREGRRTGVVKDVLMFGAGAALLLLPTLYFYWPSPDIFYFNNLGYHRLRANDFFIVNFTNKLAVILEIVKDYQFTLLAAANIFFFWLIRKERPAPLSFFFILMLAAIHFIPTPSQEQYFCVLAPYLILNVILLFKNASEQWAGPTPPNYAARLRKALPYLVLLYPLLFAYYLLHFTVFGQWVPGIGKVKYANDWRLETIHEAAEEIDRLGAGRPVITWWPGYLLETRAETYPGMENQFRLDVIDKLTPAQRTRYRIITDLEVIDAVRDGKAGVVLVGNALPPEPRGIVELMLVRRGYRLERSIHNLNIYIPAPKNPPPPHNASSK